VPERSYGGRHVGHEEDPEHADHRIEMRCWKAQVEHVAGAKRDVRQPLARCLGTGEVEQLLREVDAQDRTGGADRLRGCKRRCPAAATDVKHARTRREMKPLDCRVAETLPEEIGGIVVAIGGRVVGRGCFGPGFVRRWH
jgi:hypothetical protein